MANLGLLLTSASLEHIRVILKIENTKSLIATSKYDCTGQGNPEVQHWRQQKGCQQLQHWGSTIQTCPGVLNTHILSHWWTMGMFLFHVLTYEIRCPTVFILLGINCKYIGTCAKLWLCFPVKSKVKKKDTSLFLILKVWRFIN